MAAKLGADEVINYRSASWEKEIKAGSVNLILDCVGGSYWKGNMRVLDTDGIIVLYGLMGGVKVKFKIFDFFEYFEHFQNLGFFRKS